MDSLQEQDDALIVARVRQGDAQAYAALVRKYQARIVGMCRSMVGVAEAEDAAQEAFISAYRALSGFRETSSFYTWLYRIASNHCLTLLRSRARRPAESLDALAEHEKDALEKLFAPASDARAALEAREILDRVLAAIRPNYRLALLLRERDGLSYEEMADVLDVSVDSVKAQLRRARAEVAEKLRHFLPADRV